MKKLLVCLLLVLQGCAGVGSGGTSDIPGDLPRGTGQGTSTGNPVHTTRVAFDGSSAIRSAAETFSACLGESVTLTGLDKNGEPTTETVVLDENDRKKLKVKRKRIKRTIDILHREVHTVHSVEFEVDPDGCDPSNISEIVKERRLQDLCGPVIATQQDFENSDSSTPPAIVFETTDENGSREVVADVGKQLNVLKRVGSAELLVEYLKLGSVNQLKGNYLQAEQMEICGAGGNDDDASTPQTGGLGTF